jgi:hypothetical protein
MNSHYRHALTNAIFVGFQVQSRWKLSYSDSCDGDGAIKMIIMPSLKMMMITPQTQ